MTSSTPEDAAKPDETAPETSSKSAKAAPKTAAKRARAAVPPPPGALTAATAKTGRAKPAPADDDADDVEDVEDESDLAEDGGPELKKQELIAKVMERADVKKKYAKPVVEAVIEVLGEALAEGRELNLQPFGKLKLNRTKETANARVIIAKIRQAKSSADNAQTPKEPVADAAE